MGPLVQHHQTLLVRREQRVKGILAGLAIKVQIRVVAAVAGVVRQEREGVQELGVQEV